MDYSSLIREALEFPFPRPVPREEIILTLPKPALFNLVHIITGVRRCGKTFYLFQKIDQLLNRGVPRDHVLYFNFSDARLKPMGRSVLMDVVEEYYRQVPSAQSDGAYLFLDEVQECPDWQDACQRIAEHERATLVITGSSSKLTSDEIATRFRGRSHPHEMMPLSFREYCAFNNAEAPKDPNATFSPRSILRYETLYDRYLIEGGFPGVQSLLPAERIDILQSYVRDVVARDVAERFGREDIRLANQYALYAIRNTGCELSLNNLVEKLQEAGFKSYWEKINRLDNLFQQAFLYYTLPEYSTALKPGSTAARKAYAIDPGMAYAVSRANQQDMGKRFETAVFLEMKHRVAGRRIETITSYTVPGSKRERVDFLIGDALSDDPYELVQASVSLDQSKTRQRELGSLDAAMAATGLETGTVITLREEETAAVEHGTVRIVPAWKWALTGRP